MTPPDAPRPGSAPMRLLDVTADLRVDIDGVPGAVHVTGEGTRLTVAIQDAATALRIGRDARRLGGARETLAILTGGLSEADVDVDLTVGGRRVASVGPHAASGALARVAGFDGVEVARPPRRVVVGAAALAAGLLAGAWWATRTR